MLMGLWFCGKDLCNKEDDATGYEESEHVWVEADHPIQDAC